MNNIVIQAYGHPDIINQSKFCILSILKYDFKGRIVIYTDTPDAYTTYGDKVTIEEVTTETITDWKGPHNFVHRLKIKMLKDYSAKYSGKMLYMDCDTYFLSDPNLLFNKIENGKALMHECEGQLSAKPNPILKKTYKFVQSASFNVNGETTSVPPDTFMWNAGVIGLADEDKSVLNNVLALNDAMFEQWQKHIIEQLSFSYYLQNEFELSECKEEIMHYWGNKDTMNSVLADFFTKNTDMKSQLAAYTSVDLSSTTQGKTIKKSWLSKLIGK